MRALIALLLLASPALAETCPAVPDTRAEQAEIFATLKTTADPATAQDLMDKLWAIWTKAPDARAQGLLDGGMRDREAGEYPGAKSELDGLVSYCPAYAEGYNQRAFVEYLVGDYGSALKDVNQALHLLPNHIAALTGKALILTALGREDEAQAALRAALVYNRWLPERGMLKNSAGKDL